MRKHFDRIKVIKKLSRQETGPHGKAGPHADKRERRMRRMGTQDWLEAEEAEEGEEFIDDSPQPPWDDHEEDDNGEA